MKDYNCSKGNLNFCYLTPNPSAINFQRADTDPQLLPDGCRHVLPDDHQLHHQQGEQDIQYLNLKVEQYMAQHKRNIQSIPPDDSEEVQGQHCTRNNLIHKLCNKSYLIIETLACRQKYSSQFIFYNFLPCCLLAIDTDRGALLCPRSCQDGYLCWNIGIYFGLSVRV